MRSSPVVAPDVASSDGLVGGALPDPQNRKRLGFRARGLGLAKDTLSSRENRKNLTFRV